MQVPPDAAGGRGGQCETASVRPRGFYPSSFILLLPFPLPPSALRLSPVPFLRGGKRLNSCTEEDCCAVTRRTVKRLSLAPRDFPACHAGIALGAARLPGLPAHRDSRGDGEARGRGAGQEGEGKGKAQGGLRDEAAGGLAQRRIQRRRGGPSLAGQPPEARPLDEHRAARSQDEQLRFPGRLGNDGAGSPKERQAGFRAGHALHVDDHAGGGAAQGPGQDAGIAAAGAEGLPAGEGELSASRAEDHRAILKFGFDACPPVSFRGLGALADELHVFARSLRSSRRSRLVSGSTRPTTG